MRTQPYPMPSPPTPAVASWRPDRGRAAVLVHDMQRYFVDMLPAGRSPTTELIANIRRIRALGMPVLYSVQPPTVTRAERGLLHDLWGPGMTAAGPGAADIVDELAPGPLDQIVVKHRYSAFFRTDLAERLAALGRDQLIVCGVFASVGCLCTAADAYAHDLQTFLVADATADFTPHDHRLALDWAARRCAVTPSTAGLAGATAPPAPPASRSPASGRSAAGGS
ncbi:isochorismatase family protein [Actinoplanes sp. URMC 104]|uniref:isochorismatase family protein n=1 Tax=Actinoplanes sp. URMC 104 TaxID=3423409 RepID=UPI003F1D961D